MTNMLIIGNLLILTSVFVWVGLLKAIYGRLEKNHPEQYDALGKPSIDKNTSRKTYRLILKRQHQEFGDRKLSKLCDLVLFTFVVGLMVLLFQITGYWVIPLLQ